MKNNLKKVLKEKGLSVLELCRVTGIAPQVMYTISNEKIVPYDGWKQRIAEALEMSVEQIFPESEEV